MLFRLAVPYLRSRWKEVAGVITLQLLSTFAALELPGLNARIIDEGVAAGRTDIIWQLGIWMMILTLAQGVATGIAVYMGARVAMGMGAWLRGTLFTHAQRFSSADMHHFGAPSLITRMTNDVQQIQTVVVMAFSIMVQAPIMGIGALILAYRQDPNLAINLWVMLPVLTVVVVLIMRKLAPLFAAQQTRIDAINTVMREELSGQRVIRAFARQDMVGERYRDANQALRDVAMRIGTYFALLFPLMVLIVSATNVSVVWFGAHLINAGEAQIGSLFAFLSYVGMLFGAVVMSAVIVMMVPRADIAARRIREITQHTPSVASPENPTTPPQSDSPWTFRAEHVQVQFPGAEQPVVDDVTFTLTPGQTIAIIGSTGSGKTTLVSLFPRLLDATSGQITANGVPVTEVDLAELRRRIAVVPQRAYLFGGTIASTVSGVENPTHAQRERIEWALEGAQATEFVTRLEDGIDAEVEAGGTNFSGGQRQRLSIARALYRQADLYILDDSSSALDYATDARLRAALPTYTSGAAVLIVAQRVSSVQDADTILVLEQGRIVGQGTHPQLLAQCPTYQEIVASQETQPTTQPVPQDTTHTEAGQ